MTTARTFTDLQQAKQFAIAGQHALIRVADIYAVIIELDDDRIKAPLVAHDFVFETSNT